MIQAHCGCVELIHCTIYALIAQWVSGNYPIIQPINYIYHVA